MTSQGLYVPLTPEDVEAALEKKIPDIKVDKNRDARELHNLELFKIQNNIHDESKGSVLVIVDYPEYASKRSCNNTYFYTGRMRLSKKQVLKTGSPILKQHLESTTYQARMWRRVGVLPPGVTHVLDLSPSDEEDGATLALQQLTITTGIKLWFRMSSVAAVPAFLVHGHDDSCVCMGGVESPAAGNHPRETPTVGVPSLSTNIQSQDYLYEDKPLSDHRDIKDYCQIRQAANTIRLLRAIAGDPIMIDSAPRVWTLVGLFSMYGMTNYDILRDKVTSWMMADPNSMFVEILPEETLHIATVLKAPLIAEPAFRILVNERAIAVAGEQLSRQPLQETTFGRKTSDCLSGTEHGESLLRMIEHAGIAMAERYKNAIDTLYLDDIFVILDISEWQKLIFLGQLIDKTYPTNEVATSLRKSYKALKAALFHIFRSCLDEILKDNTEFPLYNDVHHAFKHFIPKDKLDAGLFRNVYSSLNKYQRVLCPLVWRRLRDYFGQLSNWSFSKDAEGTYVQHILEGFHRDLKEAQDQGIIEEGLAKRTDFPWTNTVFERHVFFGQLDRALQQYTVPLLVQDSRDFVYEVTPHLLLTLNNKEMNFLRLNGDQESEAMYEAKIPETLSGPSGPGPAYHTGQTLGSVTDSISDLGMDNLSIGSKADTTTIAGSVIVQDGISTVYDRRAILPPSASIMSEYFSDGDGNDFAEARYAVPAEHQVMGKILAAIVQEDEPVVVSKSAQEDESWDDEDFTEDDDVDDDLSAYSHDEAF